MNIIELNDKLKNIELDINQFNNFRFISDFVPEKVLFSKISLKEGFPGTINLDLIIEGHIKGFSEFKTKTIRRVPLLKDGELKNELLEIKTPLNKVFSEEELIDLEEEKIIDLDKNIFFLNKIDLTIPMPDLRTGEEKIEKFFELTEKIIEAKIEAKIIKFLEKTKVKEEKQNIPDELKGYISPKGFLIEPSSKTFKKKETPPLVLKIRGLNSIPSINSVIRKVENGQKLNFIEKIINKKLNEYLTKEIDTYATLYFLNKNLLKLSFERETIREMLLNDKINKTEKRKIRIYGETYETKVEIINNIANKKEINPSI